MCSNYRPATPGQLEKYFGVAAPDSEYKSEAYPGYMAPFIKKPRPDASYGDRTAALGMFGMVPHWADTKLSRQTYNARTETVAAKPTFRTAFKHGNFCVIPVESIYEPCYESGKAIRHEVREKHGDPLGVAGIWEIKQEGPNGLALLSFSMLTINADGHAIMSRMHKVTDEKRMLVLLDPSQYDDWLNCNVDDAPSFFRQFPSDRLVDMPAPKVGKAGTTSAQGALPDA